VLSEKRRFGKRNIGCGRSLPREIIFLWKQAVIPAYMRLCRGARAGGACLPVAFCAAPISIRPPRRLARRAGRCGGCLRVYAAGVRPAQG